MLQADYDRGCGMWLASFGVTAGAVVGGAVGWGAAAVGGALAFGLWRLLRSRAAQGAVRAVTFAAVAAVLVFAARAMSALFPDANEPLYVPAIVLALSWALARRGRDAALAACTVAGYFVLAAVGLVALFALPQVRLSWLAPGFSLRQAAAACAAGLGTLCVSGACPEARPGGRWQAVAFAAPAALSAVIGGSLSYPLAMAQRAPFYTLSRAISLFGVVERFEALIAACLTLGLFSAATAALRTARTLAPHHPDALTLALLAPTLAATLLR